MPTIRGVLRSPAIQGSNRLSVPNVPRSPSTAFRQVFSESRIVEYDKKLEMEDHEKKKKEEKLNWIGSGPGPASDDSVELADVDSSVLDELLVTLKK
uniref:Uncharacterized protein n=1 Tax=Cucumis melo TaxID=3656 RepID=A0A9I9E878_CUCME